ncbi:hypothetical protein K402DRAFT_388388 [Aulographum hederae CBS 113979]|uniref:Uncharacterized protein n=1 Tax=Aulographum hederae CBS 113979 TaxID=1176131 RepID=A0A6G1HFB3_9PEZI|nr:hypothetical protein K402DRAFT_388388 [Aulographum hederae CBS 113979]
MVVDLLLAHGARLENAIPLHEAAAIPAEIGCRIPMMRHLLDRGADINALDGGRNGYHVLGTP